MKKLVSAVLITALLAACYSCSENSKFGFGYRLKNAISETYDTGEIQIKIINDEQLLVSLKDSDFYAHSSAEKQEISKAIGKMANDLKKGEPFKAGTVKFVTQSSLGVLSKTETVSYNMFD
ncbi:MAG: hypothetical protein WBL27_09240 [Salinimicrobium sp.]